MIYVLEAVARNEDGFISHVRWHSVDALQGDVIRSASSIVPVEIAIHAAVVEAVHVGFRGAAGSKVGVGHRHGRTTLVDIPCAPTGQKLGDLPSI